MSRGWVGTVLYTGMMARDVKSVAKTRIAKPVRVKDLIGFLTDT